MNVDGLIDRELSFGRHIIEKFIRNSQHIDHVLDLGAGHGNDLHVARSLNKNVELSAIECYPDYAKELKEKGINVYGIDLEKDKLPFEDESVDVIIMNQVMEHVKEVFWILHEISRVLKIGGNFIVGVPNLASFHNRLLLLVGEQPSSLKNYSCHVRGYTKGDLLKLIDAGFEDGYSLKEFGGSNFYPFPPFIAKPFANLFPSMAWGIFFRFEKVEPYENDGFITFPIKEQLQTNFYVGEPQIQ